MPRYALQNITPSNGAPSPATISAAATTAAAAGGMVHAAAAAAPVMSSVHGAPVVAGAPMFMQAGGMPRHAMMGGHPGGGPPPQFAAAMGMPHPAMGGFGRPPMTNPGKVTPLCQAYFFNFFSLFYAKNKKQLVGEFSFPCSNANRVF